MPDRYEEAQANLEVGEQLSLARLDSLHDNLKKLMKIWGDAPAKRCRTKGVLGFLSGSRVWEISGGGLFLHGPTELKSFESRIYGPQYLPVGQDIRRHHDARSTSWPREFELFRNDFIELLQHAAEHHSKKVEALQVEQSKDQFASELADTVMQKRTPIPPRPSLQVPELPGTTQSGPEPLGR